MATTDRASTSPYTHSGARMNALDWIAFALMIIGALNWGLVGAFSFDLVAALFGEMSTLSRIVYILVGVSALYSLYSLSKVAKSPVT